MVSLRESFRSRWQLTGVVLLACVGFVGLVPVAGAAQAHRQARDTSCFGAAALSTARKCPPSSGTPVPSPEQAPHDLSAAYDIRPNGRDCWAHSPTFPANPCRFGSRHGRTTVMLVGNSHAGHWLPALQRIARHQHWRVRTELASQCAMSDVVQMFPEATQRVRCRSWVRHAAARVRRARPDLIVFANRMSLPAGHHTLSDSVRAYAAGAGRVFRHWRGIPVVVIRDTPAPSQVGGPPVPACLMAHPDDYAACDGPRAEWIPPDPDVRAARRFGYPVVNLNNHICGPRICQAIVGGVTAYVDGSHLGATFVRTLTPYLRPPLLAALRGHHHGHRG